MHSRTFWCARPTCLPAIHRGAWAACRPSTSAVGRPTSTPPNPLNIAAVMVAHRANDWCLPCRIHQPRSHRPGGALRYRVCGPPSNDRSSNGFTPTRSTRTPPVASGYQSQPGKRYVWRPCGIRPRSNPPTWRASLSRSSPFRAASPASSRKENRLGRTRSAFHRRPSRRTEKWLTAPLPVPQQHHSNPAPL